jgi:hypothetical protein
MLFDPSFLVSVLLCDGILNSGNEGFNVFMKLQDASSQFYRFTVVLVSVPSVSGSSEDEKSIIRFSYASCKRSDDCLEQWHQRCPRHCPQCFRCSPYSPIWH